MSDDRTNQIEELYNTPAGTPAGSFFGGTLSSIPRGLADAGSQLILQNAEMLPRSAGYNMDEDAYKQSAVSDEDYQKGLKQTQTAVSNYLRPNPYSTGIVGNTMYGLTDVGARAALGTALGGPVGGAALVGASTGQEAKNEAIQQGIDEGTASQVGVVQGGLNALGLFVPMGFGGTLAKRIVTGSLINTTLQQGGQQLTANVLDANGYHDQAAQYRDIDASQVIADLVLGGYFGGKHGLGAHELDAAVQAAGDAKYQTEAAPGAAANPQATAAHAEAMDVARSQLLNDEPVQLGDTLKDAQFIPMPDPANRAQSIDALKEAGYDPNAGRASDEDITQRFAEQLTDREAATKQYADLPDSEGGKVLSTDIARELSPDYMADRTRSAPVHEPASQFIKDEYARRLAEEPAKGEYPEVMFTAGGTGAGKTSGISGIDDLAAAKAKAQIVYDTNMNKFDSADAKIKQALDAGKNVHIVYTYRDPVDALVNGALKRAERQRKEFGTGRTVPLQEHINTHEGAFDTINRLAEKYKDDPRVHIDAVDNSRGSGNAEIVPLDSIKYPSDTDVKENLTKALNDEYQAGKIGPETYRGFAGEEPGAELQGAVRDQDTGDSRKSKEENGSNAGRERPGESTGATERTPEESLAHQIAEEAPDTPITYTDENGREVTESAKDALSRLDEEQGTMARMTDAVKAAITCALRFGE